LQVRILSDAKISGTDKAVPQRLPMRDQIGISIDDYTDDTTFPDYLHLYRDAYE